MKNMLFESRDAKSLEVEAALRLSRLLDAEKARTCDKESRLRYAGLHQRRFADTLRICRNSVPNPLARVLDVGRSQLTERLLGFYRDLHTLGFDLSVDDGGHRELASLDAVPHIAFDLLKSPDPSTWPACGRFDLIVFSEVIEHLSVAPEYVLACLGSLLADQGVLVCTTPNAADVRNRLKLAIGRNPYERIRLYPINPGHFREYTRQELCEIAASVGLQCRSHFYFNWIEETGSPVKTAALKLLQRHTSFRSFQAFVFMRMGIAPLPPAA